MLSLIIGLLAFNAFLMIGLNILSAPLRKNLRESNLTYEEYKERSRIVHLLAKWCATIGVFTCSAALIYALKL